MSVKISALVWEKYQFGGNKRMVALAIADHAHDDGSNIYPGIERLALKTLLSERTIQRILVEMQSDGWLIKVGQYNRGRGIATEFKINENWIKGDNLSPFSENKRVTDLDKRVTNDDEKGDKLSQKGDTAVSAQPSLITNTNHKSTSLRETEKTDSTNPQSEKPAMTPEGELACWLITQQVRVQSFNPTLCAWVKDGFSKQHIAECLAIARQHKPLPEIIPANYLDRIIREKPRPQKTQDAWWLSRHGVDVKLSELGMRAKPGESNPDLHARIRRKIAEMDDDGQIAA